MPNFDTWRSYSKASFERTEEILKDNLWKAIPTWVRFGRGPSETDRKTARGKVTRICYAGKIHEIISVGKVTLRSLFPRKNFRSKMLLYDTGTEDCGSMTVSDRILSWLDICEKKKTIPLPGGAEIRKPFIRRYCRSSISTRCWVMYPITVVWPWPWAPDKGALFACKRGRRRCPVKAEWSMVLRLPCTWHNTKITRLVGLLKKLTDTVTAAADTDARTYIFSWPVFALSSWRSSRDTFFFFRERNRIRRREKEKEKEREREREGVGGGGGWHHGKCRNSPFESSNSFGEHCGACTSDVDMSLPRRSESWTTA